MVLRCAFRVKRSISPPVRANKVIILPETTCVHSQTCNVPTFFVLSGEQHLKQHLKEAVLKLVEAPMALAMLQVLHVYSLFHFLYKIREVEPLVIAFFEIVKYVIQTILF